MKKNEQDRSESVSGRHQECVGFYIDMHDSVRYVCNTRFNFI